MADRQYTIVLKNKTNEKNKQKTTAPTENSTGEKESVKDPELFKGIKAKTVVATAVSVVDRVATSHVNTIALRTGYEEKQQRAQFIHGVAKKGADTLLSMMFAGSLFGAGGVLVGAVASIGSNILSYTLRQQEIEYAREVENTAIFLNQIRMGAGARREGKTR